MTMGRELGPVVERALACRRQSTFCRAPGTRRARTDRPDSTLRHQSGRWLLRGMTELTPTFEPAAFDRRGRSRDQVHAAAGERAPVRVRACGLEPRGGLASVEAGDRGL